MNDKLKEFEELMFNKFDMVCCGSLFDNNVTPFSAGKGSMFYTINPIDSRIDHGFKDKEKYDYLKPRRADINVSRFSNFMFEMDDTSLDDQLKIINGCGIPFTAIVYSGSKSYHALLALDGDLGGVHTRDGIDQYKNIWKRLSMKIEKYANTLGFLNVVDPSGKNPSRFTRYCGSIRDNGNEQKIINLGSRIKLSDFNELLKSCPKIFKSVVTHSGNLDVKDVDEFFKNAPKALVNEVKYPTNLCPAGMYPTIFRMSLWVKDLGVDKDVWLAVLNYRYFPALIKIGYNESRLDIGVNHAFGGRK